MIAVQTVHLPGLIIDEGCGKGHRIAHILQDLYEVHRICRLIATEESLFGVQLNTHIYLFLHVKYKLIKFAIQMCTFLALRLCHGKGCARLEMAPPLIHGLCLVF